MVGGVPWDKKSTSFVKTNMWGKLVNLWVGDKNVMADWLWLKQKGHTDKLCILLKPFRHVFKMELHCIRTYITVKVLRCTSVGNKIADHSDVVGLAPVQQHLHFRLNTWLQWYGQRQLQDETRNIWVWGFCASLNIRGLTVHLSLTKDLVLRGDLLVIYLP